MPAVLIFPSAGGRRLLAGGVKRARPHDGWLDLVYPREQILKIFWITGLTKVLGVCQAAGQAIAGRPCASSGAVR